MIDIEIKDLKYVSAILKYESISQAANELYITQPSLSGYLKILKPHGASTISTHWQADGSDLFWRNAS